MRHKRIKYEAILDPDLPAVPGNPDQLKQVILNLVVNSIEAVPEGGTVTIQTRAGENEIMFSVRDSGPGIDPELMPDIFQPFVTNKSTGTGLGLTIVHEIIQRHHGRVEVANNPESGAIFTIWLPIHHTQEQP
jgi:signal transduction histidine kinase